MSTRVYFLRAELMRAIHVRESADPESDEWHVANGEVRRLCAAIAEQDSEDRWVAAFGPAVRYGKITHEQPGETT